MIVTAKKVLFVGAESRKNNERTFHSATFVDPTNGYQRIQANMDETLLTQLPPKNSEVDVNMTLSERNFRLYANLTDIKPALATK